MSKYTVEGSGSSFFVMSEGKTVLGPFYQVGPAEDAREELIRQARLRRRPCLTCGDPFMSEGAHNRMCDPCRAKASDMGMVA